MQPFLPPPYFNLFNNLFSIWNLNSLERRSMLLHGFRVSFLQFPFPSCPVINYNTLLTSRQVSNISIFRSKEGGKKVSRFRVNFDISGHNTFYGTKCLPVGFRKRLSNKLIEKTSKRERTDCNVVSLPNVTANSGISPEIAFPETIKLLSVTCDQFLQARTRRKNLRSREIKRKGEKKMDPHETSCTLKIKILRLTRADRSNRDNLTKSETLRVNRPAMSRYKEI